jgi:hypothetical protein
MIAAALPAPGRASAANEPAEIIPSVSLEALLARRDAAVAQLATIAKAVADYMAIGETAFGADEDGPRYSGTPYKFREPVDQRPHGHGDYLTDRKWLEHATASVDAAFWNFLLDKSGLRTFLDAKARKEWDEQIQQNKTPPLTPDNVRATFARLHSQRGEFFERGVIAVFKRLSWDYKTNRPHAFGKRIILSQVIDAFGHPSCGHAVDALDDLERALHLLDGKPEPDHRSGVRARLWQRKREERSEDLVDAYLRIRTYRNGNAHITFLRPDLVDELNRLLAKHYPDALPPSTR